jgi:hypothetical protein
MIQTSHTKRFKPILTEKPTTGWHTYGKTTARHWKVEDDRFTFDPNAIKDGQSGDLVTDKIY